MQDPRGSTDLPSRATRLGIAVIRAIGLLHWNTRVVLEREPPVGINQQRCPPLQVGFLGPNVVFQPIIRRRAIQRFATF